MDKIDRQLRKAIADSGLSGNALAEQCGIPQPTIFRFINGADMKLSTAAKLAAYFGMRLTDPRTPKRKGTK